MKRFFNPRLRGLASALGLILAISSPPSGALAGQFSVGVIEYNAKASNGGWTAKYGKPSPPLPLQIQLITDKINDKSNPSPVQFIALVQAGDNGTRACPNDYLISCALADKGLKGWSTIIDKCDEDQTQLAYSSDWELVPNLKQNPLIDSYDRDVCWAEKSTTKSDHGRPYNIAYFQNRGSKDMVLFVVVHMPHGQPVCQGGSCPYGNGKFMWDVPQFKLDVRSVVGSKIDLRDVHLIIAGDMNDLGNDADPKAFTSIFGDFGDVQISKQTKTPPEPTCCADPPGYQYFFDRIVSNGSVQPGYEVIYLTTGNGLITYYPLNKMKRMPSGRPNKEHKATYGVAKFD